MEVQQVSVERSAPDADPALLLLAVQVQEHLAEHGAGGAVAAPRRRGERAALLDPQSVDPLERLVQQHLRLVEVDRLRPYKRRRVCRAALNHSQRGALRLEAHCVGTNGAERRAKDICCAAGLQRYALGRGRQPATQERLDIVASLERCLRNRNLCLADDRSGVLQHLQGHP